jgi:anti-sigma factor RsiW
VIRRGRHLQEERLFERYLAEWGGEPIDPPVAEHLADCQACAARYADLARFMDALRADSEAESDAIFTPERLRSQQQQIARRLDHVGRPARVLRFPGQLVRRTITASTSRSGSRWIAAAAAAGLFVGVALGASYEWESRARRPDQTLARENPLRATRMMPVSARSSGSSDVAADDAFFSELEMALDRPHTRELLAYDALTPHVREIKDTR